MLTPVTHSPIQGRSMSIPRSAPSFSSMLKSLFHLTMIQQFPHLVSGESQVTWISSTHTMRHSSQNMSTTLTNDGVMTVYSSMYPYFSHSQESVKSVDLQVSVETEKYIDELDTSVYDLDEEEHEVAFRDLFDFSRTGNIDDHTSASASVLDVALLAVANDDVRWLEPIKYSSTSFDDIVTEEGSPLLIYSVLSDAIEVGEFLLSEGVSVDKCDQNSDTALSHAVRLDSADFRDLLLTFNADVNLECNRGESAAFTAARYNNVDVLTVLHNRKVNLELQSPSEWSPLFVAAFLGNSEAVEFLLDKVDLDQKGPSLKTALYIAAEKGHLDILRLLLSAGAAIDSLTSEGWSPFTVAVDHNHVDVCRELLNWGVDVNSTIPGNKNALYLASERNQLELARFLLDQGIDKDFKNTEENNTALLAAARYKSTDVLHLLLKYDADANLENSENKTAIIEAIQHKNNALILSLAENGANLTNSAWNGISAYKWFFMNQDEALLKMAFILGVNVDSPVGIEKESGLLLIAEELMSVRLFHLFIQYKANTDVLKNTGKPILHGLLRNRYLNIVDDRPLLEDLLSDNADVFLEDELGHSLDDLAIRLGCRLTISSKTITGNSNKTKEC